MAQPKHTTSQAAGGDRSWTLVALATFLLFAWAHRTAFFDAYVINDDVRQQLFWMQRWLDPALYPRDLLGDYSRLYVPWGVQGVYRLAAFIISPLAFSKLLGGLLYTAMGALVYASGARAGGRRLGLCCVSAFWFMPFFLHSMSGGLARAFAGPLLVLFLFGWLSRSRWIVACALALQSLFIPYIFVLCTAMAGLGWLAWRFRLSGPPPFLKHWADFLVLGCACGLLLGWHMQMGEAGFGPLPWQAEMVGRPEFSEAGRYPILPVPSLLHELFVRPWESLLDFRYEFDPLGFFWLALLVPFTAYNAIRAPWGVWRAHRQPALCLAAASLILYFAARLVLFKLFLPSRYLEYSVNVGYCFLLGTCLFGLIARNRRPERMLALAVTLVALFGAVRLSGEGLHDYSGDRAVCEYIKSGTPKDALVAGHPYQMDNVLTFGGRDVFASYELAHPWNLGYWARLKPRLESLFAAYYSDDPTVVAAFCRKNGIDYLVVDDRFFSRAYLDGKPFFAPFADLIRERAARAGTFALLSPSIPAVRIDEHVRVVATAALPGGGGQ